MLDRLGTRAAVGSTRPRGALMNQAHTSTHPQVEQRSIALSLKSSLSPMLLYGLPVHVCARATGAPPR